MAHEIQRQVTNDAYWQVQTTHPLAAYNYATAWARNPHLNFDVSTITAGLSYVRRQYRAAQQRGVEWDALLQGQRIYVPKLSGPRGLTRIVIDRRTTHDNLRLRRIKAIEERCNTWQEFEEQAPTMLEPDAVLPPLEVMSSCGRGEGTATTITRFAIFACDPTPYGYGGMGWETSDVAAEAPNPALCIVPSGHVGAVLLRGLAPHLEVVDHFVAAHSIIPASQA